MPFFGTGVHPPSSPTQKERAKLLVVVKGRGLLLFSCSVTSSAFATPWTVARQAPLSMGFSRQEYWSGLLFPSPGDHSDPGIDLHLLHWQAGSLPLRRWGRIPEC